MIQLLKQVVLNNRIVYKLRNHKGMSFSELLVATLIMLLSTSVVVTTVTLAQNHFLRSVRLSEAQELYGSLEMALYNDLAYVGADTTDADAGGVTKKVIYDASENVESYRSAAYSVESTQNVKLVVLDASGVVTTSEYGEVALGNGTVYNRILGSASYPNGLGVRIDAFTYDPDTKQFSLTLSIGYSGGELLNKTFSVVTVNR